MSPVPPLLLLLLATAAAAPYQLDASWPVPPGLAPFLGLNSVTAIAIVTAPAGTEIHVAQRNASLPFFLVFARNGTLLRTWGNANVTSPHGLQAGTPGGGAPPSLWVVDIKGYVATQFDLSGRVLARVGTGRAGAGVAPPAFSAPADITFTAAGRVVVSDGDGGSNDRVLVLDATTSPATTLHVLGGTGSAPGKLSSPHSVTFEAASGLLWVADRGNARLSAFGAVNGSYVGSWTAAECGFLPGGAPWGVRIDEARGHMLVADGNVGALYVLGMPRGGGLGACTLLQTIDVGLALKPHLVGLDAASGDVYLADVGVPPTAQRYTLAA